MIDIKINIVKLEQQLLITIKVQQLPLKYSRRNYEHNQSYKNKKAIYSYYTY